MTDLPPDSSSARSSTSWRDRYDAARAQGVPLDPKSEPVDGVHAYPTSYDSDHLLVTNAAQLEQSLELLSEAAHDFGWMIELQNLDGTPLDPDDARARERRTRRQFDLPTIHRIAIVRDPELARTKPVPNVDAWRLLQRARARTLRRTERRLLDGVGLDHVLSVDPISGKTNPISGQTNPFSGQTNPFSGQTNPISGKTNAPGTISYIYPGSGGRQVVDFLGAKPARARALAKGGRRPVVAVLDTGCGEHSWLTDDIVTRYPKLENKVVGVGDRSTDPEVHCDISGAYDGDIDASAGHGTFIAGIIRQVCPEADIVAVRVADSQGTVLEGEFMLAVRNMVKMMSLPRAKGGRQVDVINLSLGYYHETPDDELFDRTLSDILLAARSRGCAIVCSAGNDATDRPAFPAALWGWPGADFKVKDPANVAPHVSVGALNPNGTMALFSNLGPWVRTYAPGAAVVSTHPSFNGGVQAGSRDDRYGYQRETIDPDDFTGGFALWSGTSFAAPHVAALLAAAIAERLMSGELTDAGDRIKALRAAERAAQRAMSARGPRESR
jgi:serine protease